jgi:hypothetical protein
MPVLPTTPFAPLAAYCAARGSERLYRRLLAHRALGPVIRDWHEHRAVSRRTKVVALGTMALSAGVLRRGVGLLGSECADGHGRHLAPAAARAHPPTASILSAMCRNIRTLHNFEPPATEDEIRAAALQYVRKVSGSARPSKANEVAFGRAVDEIAQVTRRLLAELVTSAPPRDREVEAAKARARAEKRFGAAA